MAGEMWRRLRRRLRAGPAYRWRYVGRTPERVLIAPPDLRVADAQIANEIYYGRFPFAGHLVETGGRSPFQVDTVNTAWLEALHGFRWLRHMQAADTDLAAANARALVQDWIGTHGRRIGGVAWEPAIAARRIIAWLQHSAVVLQGSEFAFYRLFLKSLALQIRFLRSMVPDMPDGEEKLRARAALAFAALSLPVPPAALRTATRNLSQELERQILPDGGHVSRSPLAVQELLADLIPLRQTYANQAESPPPALIGAVERMLPALRFFRHRDGTLARFNGMGQTVHERIASILRHDDTGGAPVSHAPHSGYDRLTLGTTTVIADTGRPPPPALSGHAHAGCLSFELSSGRHLYIVNAGIDLYGADDLRPPARATAAHSTLVINDTSSARFSLSRKIAGIAGAPLVGGPRKVACRRIDDAHVRGFVARHDGYISRFGLLHERELALSAGGLVLEGADRILRPDGRPPGRGDRNDAAIRFHIHPDVELYRDDKGRIVLAVPSGDAWVFACEKVAPRVEESIFFAALGGPQRSRQLVLAYQASEFPEVEWRFTCSRDETGG